MLNIKAIAGEKEMSAELIPFGKYKGQPLEAIQSDKQYIDWLLAQSWFKEKHEDIYTIIINNFQEPADTPLHNAMQMKFLNDDYVINLLSRFFEEDLTGFKCYRKFEKDGWDVFIVLTNDQDELKQRLKQIYYIEIKPTVSDDFPSVLRQIEAMSYIRVFDRDRGQYNKYRINGTRMLLVGEYTGQGATQDEFIALSINRQNKAFAARK
jgi:hypothetical protein